MGWKRACLDRGGRGSAYCGVNCDRCHLNPIRPSIPEAQRLPDLLSAACADGAPRSLEVPASRMRCAAWGWTSSIPGGGRRRRGRLRERSDGTSSWGCGDAAELQLPQHEYARFRSFILWDRRPGVGGGSVFARPRSITGLELRTTGGVYLGSRQNIFRSSGR